MEHPLIADGNEEVKSRVDRASGLLLFLDFDGTLAPIVQHPALADLPFRAREVLRTLSALSGVTLAIVSGRSLADVKLRVGMPGLIYAGNHGLEIEGPGLAFEHSAAIELASAIGDITGSVAARSARLTGIDIESKGLTTSVHYRRASDPARAAVLELLEQVIPPDHPTIEVREGKMVYEIRPRVAWDKGYAIAWIREQLHREEALPIVVGDDLTDENAFTAFDDAITVCVDLRKPTAAKYRLESPDRVRDFLAWVGQVWANRATGASEGLDHGK